MTTGGDGHIQALLDDPQDREAYYRLYRHLRATRKDPEVDTPLLASGALRVAMVTASNSKYLPYLDRLLQSIPAALRGGNLDVCVLDVGLSEPDAAALRARVSAVVAPGWDIEFPEMDRVPRHMQALFARPHLPRHFPGYDVYLWIDADAWVQRPSSLDDMVLPALTGAIAIVPVMSPAYRTVFKLVKGPTITAVEWGRRALRMYFGDRLSKTTGEEPVLNAGIFALRGDAPHWALWSEALRHGNARGPGDFFVEQTAINFAIYENDLKRHLLPASYNWQTHLSVPMYDAESGLYCEPHLPHDPIRIVHLTGPDKADPKEIRFLDGRTVRQSMTEPLPRDARPPEPAAAELGKAKSQLVTLPHLTQASSRGGRPLRIRTHERDETVSRFLRIQGVWQRDVSIFIDSALSDGDVVVDLGANIGYFSVLAGAAVKPTGRVHAFEPEPTNFALLKANRALNGLDNIICHQLAVGETSGRATLYRSRSNLGAHSLLQDDGLADPLEVTVTTLDEALAGESGPIALIKIDLQGVDLPALRGMTALLEHQAVKPMIIMEYASTSFAEQDPDLVEFAGFVGRNGYELFGFITNTGHSRVPPRIEFAAFRALHESFLRDGTSVEIDLLLSPGTPKVKRR